MLDPQHMPRVVPGSNGIFNPIIVIDGQVVGTWRRTFTRAEVVLTFEPFASLNAAQTASIAAAAQRYAGFVGRPARIEYLAAIATALLGRPAAAKSLEEK